MSSLDHFPFHDIVGPLVSSVMEAQAIVVEFMSSDENRRQLEGLLSDDHPDDSLDGPSITSADKGTLPESSLHSNINRCFDWLHRRPFTGGKARYFFDSPFRTSKRSKEKTRISLLIVRSVLDSETETKIRRRRSPALSLRSPLVPVLEFLTPPDMPGARAYALLALRNYLFAEFRVVLDPSPKDRAPFSADAIGSELSSIWTSLRPRYLSQGSDKLEVGHGLAGLVRHFLAMRGVLTLYFRDPETCLKYLRGKQLAPKQTRRNPLYEFERSAFLERLPDVGEVVNELAGLPIPIRGADTIFRGGLKFSTRGGLVVAIHGGAGNGKTSLALGIAAHLAPFGVKTLFITADEEASDIEERLASVVPQALSRLYFFPRKVSDWFTFLSVKRPHDHERSGPELLESGLKRLRDVFKSTDKSAQADFSIPKPCRGVVVLDGLHDFFAHGGGHNGAIDGEFRSQTGTLAKLHRLVDAAKSVQALVVFTTGPEWGGNAVIDYMVDIAIHLSHDSLDLYGAKPDRRLRLTKARHQLCSSGTHGLQIAGSKGLRFSPQINYQLDRRSIWKQRIPDKEEFKLVLGRVYKHRMLSPNPGAEDFETVPRPIKLYRGAHVFINGNGSGGKAGLALKIAMSGHFPNTTRRSSDHQRKAVTEDEPFGPTDLQQRVIRAEKILIVSFLYPKEYYTELYNALRKLLAIEYGVRLNSVEELRQRARIEVIHLYPGNLRPNDLFNRIEWELDAASLYGDPYTCVIIDGIHNVFLQFPEIESYKLFWPQIYSSLRSRPVMTITTHTVLAVDSSEPDYFYDATPEKVIRIDDNRSEPLRHALVQKTDFHIEVNPLPPAYLTGLAKLGWESSVLSLRVASAIGQSMPRESRSLLWSRENLVLLQHPPRAAQQQFEFDK